MSALLLPTSSRVELAMKCAASWTLPHVIEDAGEPAERGTALHAYLADPAHDLAKVPEEWREAAQNVDVSRWPAMAAEVAFSWDHETGEARELGRNIGRAYAKSRLPTVFAGTADLVGVGEDVVFVGDLKTGRAVQSPPAEHGQLLMLALAAARAYGKAKARVALAHLTPDTGKVFWEHADLDAWDLDLVEQALRDLASSIEAARSAAVPVVRSGEHCRYCPARFSCPAQVGLVRMLVGAPPEDLTTKTAAEAIALLVQVDETSKQLWKQLDALAREQPITLPDGRVYGLVPAKKDALIPSVVREVVTKEYGAEAADNAVEMKATKAALSAALKLVAESRGMSMAAINREALALIGAKSGITTEITQRLELKKPKSA